MELYLKNVGKIQETTIALDGITVIAGVNNTGKSTVSRAMFFVLNSFSNVDERIKDEMESSLQRALLPVFRARPSTFLFNAVHEIMEHIDLGFTPQNNGEVVRIAIPPLSEERRKEMMKKCRAEGENAKVVIRNTRRDANEEIKKLSKDKVLPEDMAKQAEKDIQDQTDKFVNQVDGILAEKEKDIMTV